jgi:type II restriction enzyme
LSTISGNSGEWSEVVVLFFLLADGKVPLVNSDLVSLEEQYLEVVEVRKFSKEGELVFTIAEDRESIILNGVTVVTSRSEIRSFLPFLVKAIAGGGKGIVIPEVEGLLARMRTLQLAAPSSDKTDMVVVVRDHRNGAINTISFSLKSQIGTPASLLNASGATSFRYSLIGADDSIHMLRKLGQEPLKIIQQAAQNGVSICCGVPLSEPFRENLQLIDSAMPDIAAEMVLGHYSGHASRIGDIVEYLAEKNPASIRSNNLSTFYLQKVRHLLSDIALGMTAGKPWDGNYSSNGGYLILKKDGSIASIMFSDQNIFRDYLLKNTKFERGSRTRHKYGNVIEDEAGKSQIDLNLQIRFIK